MPAGKPYHFHPEAWAELENADSWYRQRSPETSIRFIAAVFGALEDIARWPHTWPEYLHGARRFVLQRFPYSIVYRENESDIHVLAVAHSHRRPGYWKDRM